MFIAEQSWNYSLLSKPFHSASMDEANRMAWELFALDYFTTMELFVWF
jgi:hypothetical protein